MSREIKLTRGMVSIVSDSDYGWLSAYKWCISGRYAASRINGKLIYMHRLIMDAPTGTTIDHVNGECFDNQRSNLRFATQKENTRNKINHRIGSYKGVYWRNDTHRWQAKIMVDGKGIGLGCYQDHQEAARAYDTAARHYFGAFARTNFEV